ncbi:hypothetical protein RB213_003969 [Colletotrichum asianum]
MSPEQHKHTQSRPPQTPYTITPQRRATERARLGAASFPLPYPRPAWHSPYLPITAKGRQVPATGTVPD